jgi:hypothetical protein
MADEQYATSIRFTEEIIAAAGALAVDKLISNIQSGGAIALTLADGVPGQVKIVMMTVDGGAATLTPATFSNGTTLTFDDVNDSAVLVWDATVGWVSVGTATATIA